MFCLAVTSKESGTVEGAGKCYGKEKPGTSYMDTSFSWQLEKQTAETRNLVSAPVTLFTSNNNNKLCYQGVKLMDGVEGGSRNGMTGRSGVVKL